MSGVGKTLFAAEMSEPYGSHGQRAGRMSCEPSENEDPRNALLEAFDEMAEALERNDLGPQMRARLARFLPKPAAPPAPSRDPVFAGLSDLDVSIIVTALGRLHQRRGFSGAEHDVFRRLHAAAEGDLKARLAAHKGSKP